MRLTAASGSSCELTTKRTLSWWKSRTLACEPGKNEILQVANYLNPRGTGLFALILARSGPLTQTARWICREQWVQHSKLIVGLSDEDVIQMVRTRMTGGDPAELVRQKIEDFRLGI